jgi:uncharacterized membrane protein YeaQ/YmgE (transglycosylase-associated protein family)
VHVSGIISAIIIGLIIGAPGRLVVPGRQDIPIWLTLIIGVVAAFLGTLLATALGVNDTRGITGSTTSFRSPWPRPASRSLLASWDADAAPCSHDTQPENRTPAPQPPGWRRPPPSAHPRPASTPPGDLRGHDRHDPDRQIRAQRGPTAAVVLSSLAIGPASRTTRPVISLPATASRHETRPVVAEETRRRAGGWRGPVMLNECASS